ncbi:hypothetical protein BaOVIS_006820 [Babesia ovis]|uniref:Uncharacterized protein n=1 Tax=Babesia ovis TaxID=5869 RepID=A0A9W5WTW1_BABOV|nr:hypothetical protein BaOVIS_006820 [Babesia ovis]
MGVGGSGVEAGGAVFGVNAGAGAALEARGTPFVAASALETRGTLFVTGSAFVIEGALRTLLGSIAPVLTDGGTLGLVADPDSTGAGVLSGSSTAIVGIVPLLRVAFSGSGAAFLASTTGAWDFGCSGAWGVLALRADDGAVTVPAFGVATVGGAVALPPRGVGLGIA